MINVQVRTGNIKKLQKAFADTPRKFPQQLSSAINATVSRGRNIVAGKIAGPKGELTTARKNVASSFQTKKSNRQTLTGYIFVRKSNRLSLKFFKAKQNKKGVSYRISKKEGRKSIPGAFIVETYGGHVYKRPTKQRPTGKQKRGPSPWGVYKKRRFDKQVKKELRKELKAQIKKRIRTQRLRQQGRI